MSSILRKLATFAFIISTALAFTASTATASPIAQSKPAKKSQVDLVIALDTSGSMDNLIDSARQKIWDIVNDLATAKPTPQLRVGLISFGNDGYSAENGWTRVDVPLTEDLDTVYEKLMALRTNGGTEYVGRSIRVARTQMNWSKDKGALKMIFVAGNESADQDPKFKAMNEAADTISKDIVVNTIYCGSDGDSISRGWRDVANRADGQYANIDQSAGTVHVATPYDKELNTLSGKLNTTYIPYGSRGAEAQARQMEMDDSAEGMSGGAGASRAAAKASALYRNDSWDLVDALEGKKADLDKLAPAQLPPAMKNMNKAQREAYVKKKAAERKQIQKKIAELNKKRDAFIRAEKKKKGAKAESAFDSAVRTTIRKQAKKKNIIIP